VSLGLEIQNYKVEIQICTTKQWIF